MKYLKKYAMLTKINLLSIILIIVLGCEKDKPSKQVTTPTYTYNILLQPLDDKISEVYLTSAERSLKEYFPEVTIKVAEPLVLPDKCFNGKRYRADSIIRYLRSIKTNEYQTIVGITSQDISNTRTLTKNGKKIVYDDYGILGLGFKPGPSCVISYYRMARNIPMFSRTVVHEYMHTLGVPHCEHKHCLMQDGKGSGKNMRESNHVHADCKHIALKGLH